MSNILLKIVVKKWIDAKNKFHLLILTYKWSEREKRKLKKLINRIEQRLSI